MSLSTQPIVGNATPAPKFEDKRLLQLIKRYLRTNKTSVFLGEIVKTYGSQNLISHGGNAPEYCIDKEIVELLERPANAGWRTKFTLSCLTAIKSTIYHSNFKPAAKVLLHSAKLFGNRMRYRNDQDKRYISVAWHYLLDNRISLNKMEELLLDFDTNRALVPYDFGSIKESTTLHAREVVNVRDLTLLILDGIKTFPVLRLVDLDHQLLDQYIRDHASFAPLSTLHFANTHTHLRRISLQTYSNMLNALLQNDDGWKSVAHSLTFVHDMKSRDRNTTGTPEQCTIANSLDSLGMDEFQEFMRGYVLRASSASTSHANRAAVIIAEKMGEVKLLDNTRQNSKLNAMRKFVQKDKWMMCAQIYYDFRSKLQLYNLLIEAGKYIEAKRLADDGGLHRHVNEIDPQWIIDQHQREEKIYLPFPAEKVPVTMIDTLDKLLTLAHRLELSLNLDSEPSETATSSSLRDMLMMIKEPESDEARTSHRQSTTTSSTLTPQTSAYAEIQGTNIGLKRTRAAAQLSYKPSSSQVSSTKGAQSVPVSEGASTATGVVSFAQKVRRVTISSSESYSDSSSGPLAASTSSARDSLIDVGMPVLKSNIGSDSIAEINCFDKESSSFSAIDTNLPTSVTWPFRHIVGIDIEWYAAYKSPDLQPASIMQLAMHDHVYIIDIRTLSAYDKDGHNRSKIDLQMRTLAHFLRRLFNDRSILKLTFAYDNCDENMLQRVPGGFLGGISTHAQHIFDLQRDSAALEGRFSVERSTLGSLSDFCGTFLGKPLHKGERLSAWNNRPLTTSQLHYAALDAHNMIAVLDVMLLRSQFDLGLNVYRDYYEASCVERRDSS
jgi:hypothetical protein